VTSRRTGNPPAAAPRPPLLTALGAPASPWRPTHRYTSSGGNGRTQTQTQRTTDTLTSHKGGRGPQTLTGPYPIVNVAPRTQVRGGPARGLMRSPKSPPVMQRWVGGHHATAAAPPRLMTAEGSRWVERKRGIRISNHPYFPLSNQRTAISPRSTCMQPTATSKGLPSGAPPASRGALAGATPLLVTGTLG
jgi:hypothetical protein